MKPTWESGDVKLYLGDCLEVLPTLEDGSVDAVVTDPPYSGLKGGTIIIGNSSVAAVKNLTVTVGDIWGANWNWITEAWNVARNAVMTFCSHSCICDARSAFPDEAKPICLLVWHKRNASPPIQNVPRFTDEYIWVMQKHPGLDWKKWQKTMFDIPKLPAGCMATERILKPNSGKALHPTQKPVELMERLLDVQPESVLDPFMGLGTTGVACVKTGRKFIGIEIDEGYFEIAKKRIMEAQMQPRLEGLGATAGRTPSRALETLPLFQEVKA